MRASLLSLALAAAGICGVNGFAQGAASQMSEIIEVSGDLEDGTVATMQVDSGQLMKAYLKRFPDARFIVFAEDEQKRQHLTAPDLQKVFTYRELLKLLEDDVER
ncbi:MAG: hypothetical protein AAB036_11350 [Elusimicrobiota bacterium]